MVNLDEEFEQIRLHQVYTTLLKELLAVDEVHSGSDGFLNAISTNLNTLECCFVGGVWDRARTPYVESPNDHAAVVVAWKNERFLTGTMLCGIPPYSDAELRRFFLHDMEILDADHQPVDGGLVGLVERWRAYAPS